MWNRLVLGVDARPPRLTSKCEQGRAARLPRLISKCEQGPATRLPRLISTREQGRAAQPPGRGRPVHSRQAVAAVADKEEHHRNGSTERHPRLVAGAAVQRATETRPSTAKSDRHWRGHGAESPRRPGLVSSQADASPTVAPWPLTSHAAALPRAIVFVPQGGHLSKADSARRQRARTSSYRRGATASSAFAPRPSIGEGATAYSRAGARQRRGAEMR